MYAPQPTMMPAIGRVLDHVAGDRGVGLDGDADAARRRPASVPVGRLGLRLRIRLPCTTASRPPSLKLQADDAERRAVDGVVGDHRALEAELRVDRDLADVGGGVADDLDVGGGVAAHRRDRRARLMRLPRTMTLPARNTLMALPYWPEPPATLAMSSMRLSMTSVPSSPLAASDAPGCRRCRRRARCCSGWSARARRASRSRRPPSWRRWCRRPCPEPASSRMPLRPEPITSQSTMRRSLHCSNTHQRAVRPAAAGRRLRSSRPASVT